jgi:hypothetical protein
MGGVRALIGEEETEALGRTYMRFHRALPVAISRPELNHDAPRSVRSLNLAPSFQFLPIDFVTTLYDIFVIPAAA